MHRHGSSRFGAIFLGIALAGCGQDVTQPTATATLDLLIVEEMVTIPAEDFEEANVSKSEGVCQDKTPSGHLILKDANPNTPSQPCPPPFVFRGSTQQFAMRKEWVSEDQNRNGVVCVREATGGRFIVKDDNAETPSQPCPPAFSPAGSEKPTKPEVPAKILAQADDNDNGAVCLRVMENSGNYVVRDDNTDLPSQPCAPAYSHELVGKKVPLCELIKDPICALEPIIKTDD